MPKDDLIQVEGKVTNIAGGGFYQVELESGTGVHARLCGKMKRFRIRVIVGDRVTVSLSPYDVTHGLITFRKK